MDDLQGTDDMPPDGDVGPARHSGPPPGEDTAPGEFTGAATAPPGPPYENTAPGGPAAPGRTGAGWALVFLGLMILAVVGFTTPWRLMPPGTPTVPPDPARDFGAAEIARAAAFDAATSLPGYLSLGLTVLFAGLLVLTPFGAKVLGRLRGPWWVRVVLGVVVLTVIVEAVRWPLGVWSEVLLRDYGLSTQDWAAWTGDRLKGRAVNVLLLSIMVLVVVALARKLRRWWIPAAAGAFAFTLATSFIYPVVFEPLFNDFRSMPGGALRANLMLLAERADVPVEDVLIADASRRTNALNAYVSGFGATRRIVVYDTLLRAPQSEVELVVAHELGHAKYGDVLAGTLVAGLGAAFGAVLLFLLLGKVRRRTGIASAADPRAVGVIMGLMSLATIVSGPAQNLVSRHVEARADLYALNLTKDPATFISMQKRLAITNISDLSPDAVEYALYVSHPTAPQRIAMAREWAALNGQQQP